MKTKMLLLLNMELSRSQIIDILTTASVYYNNGILSKFEYYTIFDCCVDKLQK